MLLSVTGVVWITQDAVANIVRISRAQEILDVALAHWVPTLAFSCAMDGLSTIMIAGRLIVGHRRMKKLGISMSRTYLPVVIIFIESAALSTISKILQLTIPSFIIKSNLIVIPLCVSA
jgi:heme/copper-type cytochrome/quinol oxidase subunit 1